MIRRYTTLPSNLDPQTYVCCYSSPSLDHSGVMGEREGARERGEADYRASHSYLIPRKQHYSEMKRWRGEEEVGKRWRRRGMGGITYICTCTSTAS